MSDILIFTTGDRAHGFGHVKRMLVLAGVLRERGHAVAFATEHETPGLAVLRQAGGYAVYDFAPGDLSWARGGRRYGAYHTLIVDVEGGPSWATLETAYPNFDNIVVIGGSGWTMNDRAAIEGHADLFVCQTVLETDCDLNGAEYIIIDPRFASANGNAGGHILVSMGGGDPHGLTPRVIDALGGIGRKVVVVNGPAADSDEQADGVEWIHAPPSLLPYLVGAALLVGALGMTAYEAAAAGVPALLSAWSEDHENITKELAILGYAVNLGTWDKFDGDELRASVTGILEFGDRWSEMSAVGKALIDGKGAARVADAIEELIAVPVLQGEDNVA